MMKYFSSVVFFAVFSAAFFLPTFSVYAQTPTGTPPDDDVLKISTTLIQVDVTVTDKDGKVVTDLKPEDFEVYENGEKQNITNFSFVSIDAKPVSKEGVKSPPITKNSVPIPPVKLKVEQVRRTYALVVDDLGLNFASTFWVKQSLRKFVNEQMQEGDLVAIIRTGIGIGALQSFTSDKRQLMAAIEKIKWNFQGRSGISTFAPLRPSLKEELAGRVRDGEIRNPEGVQGDSDFAREIEEFRNENFSVGTLGSLNYIIRGMRDLPGRKAIMLFSEGFALTYSGKSDRIPLPNRVLSAMRVLADLANRSSVVIYTLDPRGLQEPGMFSAEDDVMNPNTPYALEARENRERTFGETQHSLRYLAYETGGFPFVNQNDLDLGMRRVIADQSSYYLLGYQPDSETFDPNKNKFNKLEIRVKRPDLKVRYRSGFFGVTDEKIKTVARTPHQQIADAVVSPFGANEINIELYSIFYNDHQDRDFIRTLAHINAKDLTFTPGADGIYRAKFDVIAMLFDSNGAAASNKINSVELTFTKKRLAKIREKGLIYDLPVTIVKNGAYQFRVALRDSGNGKIGAASQFIEVPNLKENKLTLSGFILENYTPEEWGKISFAQPADSKDKSAFLDTTLRRFERGTILRYNYVVYNAKTKGAQKPQLQTQMRLIRDGKVILEGSPKPFDASGQTDLQRLQASGAIALGSDLAPGNYILQVIAFDNANAEKQRLATQFVEFEIVK